MKLKLLFPIKATELKVQFPEQVEPELKYRVSPDTYTYTLNRSGWGVMRVSDIL